MSILRCGMFLLGYSISFEIRNLGVKGKKSKCFQQDLIIIEKHYQEY